MNHRYCVLIYIRLINFVCSNLRGSPWRFDWFFLAEDILLGWIKVEFIKLGLWHFIRLQIKKIQICFRAILKLLLHDYKAVTTNGAIVMKFVKLKFQLLDYWIKQVGLWEMRFSLNLCKCISFKVLNSWCQSGSYHNGWILRIKLKGWPVRINDL